MLIFIIIKFSFLGEVTFCFVELPVTTVKTSSFSFLTITTVVTVFPFFPDRTVVALQIMVMEGKATDVSLFVLFRFLKALFELAFFLETVLLGHLSLFLLSLHDTTLVTEVL